MVVSGPLCDVLLVRKAQLGRSHVQFSRILVASPKSGTEFNFVRFVSCNLKLRLHETN